MVCAMSNTVPAPTPQRRGLAIAALIVGIVATAVGILFMFVTWIASGNGLSYLVEQIVLWAASLGLGIAGVTVGIVSVVTSRPRLLGWIGLALSMVPFITFAIAVSFPDVLYTLQHHDPAA